jgi:hypothetical protein
MALSDDDPTREPKPPQTEQPSEAALSIARIHRQLAKAVAEEQPWAVELRKFQEKYARAVQWLKVNEPEGEPRQPSAPPPQNSPGDSAESIMRPAPPAPPSVTTPAPDLSKETPEMRWCITRAQSPEIIAMGFTSGAKLAEQVLKDFNKGREENDDMENFNKLENTQYLARELRRLKALPPNLMGNSRK